jgi:threonine dehydrogenase-like Zn-dependent dehydrogenase
MLRGRCRRGSIILRNGVISELTFFLFFSSFLLFEINGAANEIRLPSSMSLSLGALLEPLSVAIQASKRASLAPGSTVLVFGAGAVGLLVAAMAKISGAGTVVIADIDAGRVQFAVENKFAHKNYTVPMKRGNTIEEQLEIAKEVAAEVGNIRKESGGEVGEVDAVFECTGVPSCVQASIFVSPQITPPITASSKILTNPGN